MAVTFIIKRSELENILRTRLAKVREELKTINAEVDSAQNTTQRIRRKDRHAYKLEDLPVAESNLIFMIEHLVDKPEFELTFLELLDLKIIQ